MNKKTIIIFLLSIITAVNFFCNEKSISNSSVTFLVNQNNSDKESIEYKRYTAGISLASVSGALLFISLPFFVMGIVSQAGVFDNYFVHNYSYQFYKYQGSMALIFSGLGFLALSVPLFVVGINLISKNKPIINSSNKQMDLIFSVETFKENNSIEFNFKFLF